MSEKKKSPEEVLRELEQRYIEANKRLLQAKDDVLRMQSVLIDAQQHVSRTLQEIVGVKDFILEQRSKAAAASKVSAEAVVDVVDAQGAKSAAAVMSDE